MPDVALDSTAQRRALVLFSSMNPSDETILFALREWRMFEKKIILNVQGNSMLPLIKSGEKVTVRLTNPHGLRRGDLFAFETGENITVHRFVKKRSLDDVWWFCEVGDNVADWRWVQEGKVLGVVQTVQGADMVLNMQSPPWVWMNSIFGFMISFSVTLCEDLERARSWTSWHQGARTLHRTIKMLHRRTSKVFLAVMAQP
jgi:hypothetical protein